MKAETKGDLDLALVEMTAWGLTVAATTLAFLDSTRAALSLLAGALISNLSFLLLKRGLLKVVRRPDSGAKTRFMIKYYLKIALIGVILIWLIRSGEINKFYLLAGLGAVFIAIFACTVPLLARGGKKSREAS